MKRLFFVLFLCSYGLAQAPAASSDRPWMNKSLSPEKRAELVVKAMTLDEKISQIHMRDIREFPREVIAIERLGIPTFKISNGPLGAGPGDSRQPQPATAFPAALGLAATWEPKLAEQFGRIAAEEIGSRGEHLWEAPGLNITRVPHNGRNFEYFGEDPFLTARLGVATVKGAQAVGIIAEPKHYAANNQERDRKTVNEVIDERTLREIYLPAFEAVVKEADAGAIMTAYPSINGQFGVENVHLLKDILRGEWGFKGFVQSDYTATRNAVASATAGLDLSMKPDHYSDEVKNAIAAGQLTEATVDTMLLRRFSVMFRLGWFDNPPKPGPIPAEKNGAVARQIATEGAVLLKNAHNELPLEASKIRTIALIGPYAADAHTGGGGSSAVTPLYKVTPQDGLQHIAPDAKISYHDGSNPAGAAQIARQSEVAIVMVGNRDRENQDRPNFSLPEGQDALIEAVAAANPRTVVILKTGGPVLMPWVDKVSAILQAWYPGEEDGRAMASLLFGRATPSGKLPMTFPKSEKEVPANTPAQYPGVNGVATYSEKLQVGYRWYDAQDVEPLFPFGFGLSYTTFKLSGLKISGPSSGQVTVDVDVTNTGKRDGFEVVQVYLGFPENAGEPPKQLKGFARAGPRPGMTEHVTIALDRRAFSIWDTATNQWKVVPGRFQVMVGNSSRDLPLRGSVDMK